MPATAGNKVLVDWAHNFDFSRPKTITWAPGTPAPNETIENRIRDTIKGDPEKTEAKVVHRMGKAFEQYPPPRK